MNIRERVKQFILDYNVRDIFRAQAAPTEELVDIIEQAVAAEREACAKLADDVAVCYDMDSAQEHARGNHTLGGCQCGKAVVLRNCAAAIRARGKEAGDE